MYGHRMNFALHYEEGTLASLVHAGRIYLLELVYSTMRKWC